MFKSSIYDFDQDNVILNTNVTVGKSYKSKGWALSRQDISKWIPVDVFERDCLVKIDNICSKAIIRFNPRLFYQSDELSNYLKDLFDQGYSNCRIPMKIKINKSNLFSCISSNIDIENYLNIKYIDTQLLVGKSYKSKGWQLSKDVTLKLFPLKEYDKDYLIYINEIESNAKLNFQFRLFYKHTELSEYLQKLHDEGYKGKINAKIIFSEDFNSQEENDDILNSNSQNILFNKDDANEILNTHDCEICGNSYNNSKKSLDEEDKYLNFCSECVEKIISLDTFYLIQSTSLSNFTKKEFIKDKINNNFDQLWDLLIKYEFLVPFGDLYKLEGNEFIENTFSKFILDDDNKKSPIKRKKNKILELVNDEGHNKHFCSVCGEQLNNYETDICELCRDKFLASDYLQDIVTKVPYGIPFTKSNLIEIEGDELKSSLIINKLLKFNLFILKSDNLYQLNNLDILNDFLATYSDSSRRLQINYINDSSGITQVSKNDLASEKNWMKLLDGRIFMIMLYLKKINMNMCLFNLKIMELLCIQKDMVLHMKQKLMLLII